MDNFDLNKITGSRFFTEVFGSFKFGEKSTIGEVVSALLPYIFGIAGLALFGAIIWAGFLYLTSGGDPKKNEEAKGCFTSSVIGFAIIFLSWWIIRILETVLGISVFGG